MGNIFRLCQPKDKIVFHDSLCEPILEGKHDNLDFIELSQIQQRLEKCEYNILTLEKNCQENLKLMSRDLHDLNTIICVR